jgi:hypothetical protein
MWLTVLLIFGAAIATPVAATVNAISISKNV